ncbi:hypothetical protein ACSBR2_036304 [Camellia fascicularis]
MPSWTLSLEYITVEELSSLGYKVNIIHNQLQNQLALCYKYLVHTDNTKILKALLCAKEDQLPLIDGYTKKRVHIDVLRRKNVLLLISNVDLSYEEHFFLHQLYIEAKQHPKENQYEVVWIPVMKETTPWDEVHQNKFKHIKASMLWFSVYQPSLLDPGVIKYINEVWNFNNKTMILSIDPQGKVVNHDAIYMCWIWGNHAFPFSSMREETLWEEMHWTIESLAGYINLIVDWIASEKYICLYGGEDLDWIRSFTNPAKAVAKATQIPLELLYVGKSNPGRKVVKINNVIMVEKLSHTMPDLILIWHFWDRFESMWHSKKQHGKSVGNDPIIKEIKSILSFDKSDQGWAMISRGGTIEMAKAKGNTILKSLNQFEKWKDRVKEVDFLMAFNENLNELGSLDHCNTLIIPYAERSSSISEMRACDDCGRLMEEFIVFS